jgi:putative polyhydroxyalkanoate system protein
MKTLEVRVPYQISREEIRRRMDEALVKARNEYGSQVGPINAAWEGDILKVALSAMGMSFNGTIEIEDKDVLVKLGLPGMASFFSGKIKAGIEEQLGSLVSG